MRPPLVHFSIPVRNVAPWLDEALASLHSQTESRWTATVVDDDSDDDTAVIASRWARRDGRLELLQPGRVGLSGGLNLGLSRHRGAPFIGRFDGDDVCTPERIEKQLHFFGGRPDVDVLDSRFSLREDIEDVAGGMLRYQAWHDSIESHEDFERELLVENPICHPTSMVRRSALEGLGAIEETYRTGDFPEDYDLWLRLARAGCRFHKLPERLVFWRDRPTRATRTDPIYRHDGFFALKWQHLKASLDLESERVVVWGAKKRGKPWIRALVQSGHPPLAVVDIDPKVIGNQRQGIEIMAPEALAELRPTLVLIAVGSQGARPLIQEKLAQLGLRGRAVVGLS